MFNWKFPREKTGLVKARDDLFSELNGYTADEPQYSKIMIHVDTLSKLIDSEKSERLSPNTALVVVGNVVIAVIVVAYESRNVITTKVVPFLGKVFK